MVLGQHLYVIESSDSTTSASEDTLFVSTFLCTSGIRVADHSVSFSVELQDFI